MNTEETPRILLKTEGGRDLGIGHVLRSLTLADRLDARGLGPVGFWSNDSPQVTERIRRSRFPLLGTGDQGLVERLDELDPSGLLIDQDSMVGPIARPARRAVPGVWMGALDCFEMELDVLDLVVNLFNHAQDHPRPVDSSVRYMEGVEYAILRETFRPLRDVPLGSNLVEDLLVSFGGSDPSNNTERVLRSLPERALDGATVHVVVGPWFDDLTTIEQLSAKCPLDVELHDDPEGLERLMATADLAISGSGTTALELAYLGIPSLLLAQTDAERRFAMHLDDRGIARLVGRGAHTPVEGLQEQIRVLVHDDDLRRTLSEGAREAVDGRGADRIAREIEAGLEER